MDRISYPRGSGRTLLVLIIIVVLIILLVVIVRRRGHNGNSEDRRASEDSYQRDYLVSGKNRASALNAPPQPALAFSLINPHVSYPIIPYQRPNGARTGLFQAAPSDTVLASASNGRSLFGFNTGLLPIQTLSNPNNSFTLSVVPSTVTITPGGSSASCKINLVSSSNVRVSLYGSNIPVGVTVTTTSNTLSQPSPNATLTFTATSKARVQNTYIYVLGYSGNKSFEVKINLNITGTTSQSSFSLHSSSTSAAITQGGSTASTISVVPISGFTGTVAFSASGLPSGVTASFNPTSSATSSVLTLTSTSTAATGTSTITITGTSGSLIETTTISLTVSPPAATPSFTLTSTPVTVIEGSTGTSTISLSGSNSFSGTVALSVSGLPTGVVGVFNPPTVTVSGSTPVTSTLTLSATTAAPIGSTTALITGLSGSLSITTNLSLTVNGSNGGGSGGGSVVTTHSQNWSGYVSANSLTKPTTNSATSVAGTFTIPSLSSVVSTTNNNVSLWVGIDGAFSSDPTVQQLGVDLAYSGGTTQVYAWYEMYPAASNQISGFPAAVGDVITVSANVISTSGKTSVYALTITNVTQNESVTIPTSQTTTTSGLQQCVEWIVEAPSIGNSVVPLSEFSPITWTNCTATINGVTGPISSFPSELINMVSSAGAAKDSTSSLNGAGNSFGVTWVSQ